MSDDLLIHFIFGFIAAIIIALVGINWVHGLGIWLAIHSLVTIYTNYGHGDETEYIPKIAVDGLSAAVGYLVYNI